MPLSMAKENQDLVVKKVGGTADVRQFLENLGFVVGAEVTVVSFISGNVIVKVKGTRVGISEEMARKILV